MLRNMLLIRRMSTSFCMKKVKFDLPDSRIAKFAPAVRGTSRLLAVSQLSGVQDLMFENIINLLPNNTHLIMNDSKVVEARLWAIHNDERREVMLLNPESESFLQPSTAYLSTAHNQLWRAMIRGKVIEGDFLKLISHDAQNHEINGYNDKYPLQVFIDKVHEVWEEEGEDLGTEVTIRILSKKEQVKVNSSNTKDDLLMCDLLRMNGDIPIPPYLNRESEARDSIDYQTVYHSSDKAGSVAAPTAGLHFTADLLNTLNNQGVTSTCMSLHVSAGTFKPVTVDCISEHEMHAEVFEVDKESIQELLQAVKEKKNIVTVGTTSTRLVETLYWLGVKQIQSISSSTSSSTSPSSMELKQWETYKLTEDHDVLPSVEESLQCLLNTPHVDTIQGATALCIIPNYQFKIATGGLITNFHQPDSTLLLLVSAYLQYTSLNATKVSGADQLMSLYRYAIDARYNFLSYGDSSLIANFPLPLVSGRNIQEVDHICEEEESSQQLPKTQFQYQALKPSKGDRVLLHSCCAPCSGAMIDDMVKRGLDVTIYFYNPNIHPREEYEMRKEENKRYAAEIGVPFIDADYDTDNWFERAKGLEWSPERGARCSICFDMRMEKTALYAAEHNYQFITSTNATSRWKDERQVDSSGLRAAAKYAADGVNYWVSDWRDDTMTARKYQINADRKFYKQEYCGCSYSLRDVNAYRRAEGKGDIRIPSSATYEDADADAEEESEDNVESFFKYDAANERSRVEERRKNRAEARGIYVDRKKDASGNLNSNNW